MDNRIINRAEVINSLQVSVLRNIPAGDFNPGIGFLVKILLRRICNFK